MEIFNECCTFLMIYHLIVFSQFYDNVEVKYYIVGNSYLYSTYTIIILNTSVILY